MIQRLPELHRIYQGVTVPVSPVMFMQIRAGEHEGCYLPAVLIKADVLKVAAHAQIKGPSEDVRGLKAGCRQ